MTGDARGAVHLENGRLAAYLDRRLPAQEVAAVEAHLADCAECRAEVVALSGLRRTLRRPRRIGVGVSLAAAAVLAFLLIGRPSAPNGGDGPVLRNGSMPGEPHVAILTPVRGGAVPAESLTFSWRPISGSASYRVTLTDSSGGVLWSTVTADTLTRAPGVVPRGARLYWYVDVLLSDGRTATSGIQEVRTAP